MMKKFSEEKNRRWVDAAAVAKVSQSDSYRVSRIHSDASSNVLIASITNPSSNSVHEVQIDFHGDEIDGISCDCSIKVFKSSGAFALDPLTHPFISLTSAGRIY